MDFFEFAYIDGDKISKFLAQQDRGSVNRKVVKETTTSGHGAKAGANFAGIVKVGGGLEKSSEFQNEMGVESIAEGDFSRFRDLIKDQTIPMTSDAFSLSTLRKRAFCEIDSVIHVSPLRQLLSILSQAFSLPPGLIGGDDQFKTVAEQFRMIGQLFQTDKIPITINDNSGKPVALSVLSEQNLLLPIEEVEDEYSLLGKVVQIIQPDDQHYDLMKNLLNPAVLRLLPPMQQQQMVQVFQELSEKLNQGTLGPETFKLSGPLVILSPIAIYR